MVRVENLLDDQLTANISVMYCIMMSHGGEILALYRGLNQSHHEYVLSTNSRLKGYEEKVASLTGLELQVSTLKKQISGLNDKLATSDASFAKSKAKGKERKVQGELLSLAASVRFERGLSMHRTKDEFDVMLKKMVNFMLGAQDRHAEASLLVAQSDYAFLNKIYEHATEPLSVILQLEPEKLARPANVLIPRDTRASPPIAKESTATPVSKSLELSVNVVLASSVVASERNEELVYAAVDGLDLEMADVAAVELERVSSGPIDVVVALFVDGKGNVLIPSSVAGEEFGFVPGALFVVFPFLLLLDSSTDGLVLIPTDTSWLRHNIRSSPSFGMANVDNLPNFLLILRKASSASFIQPGHFAVSILVRASRRVCFSFASFGMNLLMAVSCTNKLRI
ncbi:hypothetical protein Tco_0782865 [Tanacetum coccineum]